MATAKPPIGIEDAGRAGNADLLHASLVIGLIVCAALVTFGVYSAAILVERYFSAPPQFLSFVVVLTSFLTIAVILRVGLHEIVDLKKVDNPWIKILAATPSLAIIACLLAALASFSAPGLSDFVMRAPTPSLLRYMVASVGVSCDTPNQTFDPNHEASYLLALISSRREQYIRDVTDVLRVEIASSDKRSDGAGGSSKRSGPAWSQIEFVDKSNKDQIYRLLKAIRGLSEVKSDSNWIGYKIPIQGTDLTKFPLPAIFDDYDATTYLFLVQPNQKPARTAAAGDPTLDPQIITSDGSEEPSLSLQQVFDLVITPEQPSNAEERAQFNFTVHTNPDCWWNIRH